MADPKLLLSFYGDDFTGSTDAMESLARAGVRTVLFTETPTREQLARHPGIRAFGVAGLTRSMPPDEMERTLRPAFESLRASGAPVVHYKVCSTFDSSPTVGSIGRVIDVGTDVFKSKRVPVVVGAPSLGRYCVFGNLFARSGTESEPFRLDRHPSMSRHPVTPMDEADLRLHLAKQTSKSIAMFDTLHVDLPRERALTDFDRLKSDVVLIDLMRDEQLANVGALIARSGGFVVGSSGVESALAAHWGFDLANFTPVVPAPKVLVICGSCSPVTDAQIDAAEKAGFASVSFHLPSAFQLAAEALNSGRSVVVHSLRVEKKLDVNAILTSLARDLLDSTDVRRVVVAGGDTSGAIARALGIQSLEMIGELTRGAPLCRASAPGSPANGIEITFKGGQIGPKEFFLNVQRGN